MSKVLTRKIKKYSSKTAGRSKLFHKKIVKSNSILFILTLVLLISSVLLANFSISNTNPTRIALGQDLSNLNISRVGRKSLILDLDFGHHSYSLSNPQKLYNLVDQKVAGTLGADDQDQESDPNFDPNGFFSFDGKNQMMSLDGKNAPKKDFTYEMWLRAGSNTQTAYTVSTEAGDDQKSTAGIKIKDDYWWIMGINDGGMVYIPFPDKTVDESWHHVVATRKDEILTIYLDGVSAEVTRDINKYNLANDFITIGAVRQGGKYGEFFNGDIAQLRIYTRALTNNEVLDSLRETKPNFIK